MGIPDRQVPDDRDGGAHGVLRLAIRDDDVFFATPVEVLQRMREVLWLGRRITYGIVPHASPGSFQRPLPVRAPGAGHRDMHANRALTSYLRESCARGEAELAVHGLTHDSVRDADGRTGAEFSLCHPAAVTRLLDELGRWHGEAGITVFVPPHNDVHPAVAHRCLEAGFHVCRSLTDGEVGALAGPGRRDEAKKRCPFVRHGRAVELFQTLLISKERVRREGAAPVDLALRVGTVLRATGMAIVTVHWWDAVQDETGRLRFDDAFVAFLAEFLAVVEAQGPVAYVGLGDLARQALATAPTRAGERGQGVPARTDEVAAGGSSDPPQRG